MKPITIVGGGLAGLTLGIGLRQRNVPVTVWEAGRYPRHRVCGEFISGRGLETLSRLGLRGKLVQAGGRDACSAAFFSHRTSTPSRPLPESALCLSRHVMDELLAREFRNLGGELRENERWQTAEFGEGMVRATGRRAQAVENGVRLFGLKIHARRVELTADLEMHLSPRGYVGLCQLADGEINVCGLFRSATPVPTLAQSWKEWLCGESGSPLRQRFETAVFDEASFCSVAGLSLQTQTAGARDECSVGDAITMIPPVTGNGMSMAFESAELAIEPLAAYSKGDLTWSAAQREAARRCDGAFANRLRWAAWLQSGLFQPPVRTALLLVAPHCGFLWRGLFGRTR